MLGAIENPYALHDALARLDAALDDTIALFTAEKNTAADGAFTKGDQAYAPSHNHNPPDTAYY
jgi:hypothetical protein